MKKVLAIYLCVAVVAAFSQTTYFIDFDGGNDSNVGTAEASPWKRHPRMNGWSGSAHTPVAGDRYIFKGGVTWPSNCFPMRLIHSGTVNAWLSYTSTNNWFTGGSWSRPIFDFEKVLLSASGGWPMAGFMFDGVTGGTLPRQYIWVADIDFRNHAAPLPSFGPGAPQHGASTILLRGDVVNTVISNCVVKDWVIHGNPTISGNGGGGGGINKIDGDKSPTWVFGTDVHQAGTTQKTGRAFWGNFFAHSNAIHDTSCALVGGGQWTSNHIYDLTQASDPTAHENGLLLTVPSLAAYNTFSNTAENCIYAVPNFSYGSSTSYNTNSGVALTEVYNNLMMKASQPFLIEVANSTNAILVGVRAWNNTVVPNTGASGIRVSAKEVGTSGVYRNFGWLEVFNNHVVSDNANPILVDSAGAPHYLAGPGVWSNLVQTVAQATSDGYTLGDLYRPQSASAPSVGTGINLVNYLGSNYVGPRPTNDLAGVAIQAPWDYGAYWFAVAGPARIMRANTGNVVLLTVQ